MTILPECKDFPAFVYTLEDPREPGHLRYVGKTAGLATRWHAHRQAAVNKRHRKHDAPLYVWWRQLLSQGITPRMRVLWQGEQPQADEAETKAILGYRKLGMLLLNQIEGGKGVAGFSQTPWNKGLKGAQVAWNKGRKANGTT